MQTLNRKPSVFGRRTTSRIVDKNVSIINDGGSAKTQQSKQGRKGRKILMKEGVQKSFSNISTEPLTQVGLRVGVKNGRTSS